MSRTFHIAALAAMVMLLPFAAADAADESGFKPIFDGKSLDGWEGNLKLWSVKDGAITGQTTKENPTRGNTFIVWRKGELADFELRLKFRIVGGNSGVQYRSKEVKKWVIAGYQADFDAAGGWTGSLYEEKGRGMLAKRGNKVVIDEKGKKKTVGKTTPEKEIRASIKKEDWNDYTIIAKGNHLVQVLNGNVTIDVTDHQESRRAMKGLLALQLHAGPPMLVQFKDIRLKELTKAAEKTKAQFDAAQKGNSAKKKIVFVAGRDSHGKNAHEHTRGCKLLAKALDESGLNVETDITFGGWPKDPEFFKGADAVVIYCDGGGGHVVNRHLEQMDKLADAGVGLVCLHYGVEVPKGKSGDAFLEWIGGYFETNWSVNPHWTADFKKLPDHPIANGVKPFKINDEWYFHMRFRKDMKGVTPILSAIAPESTMKRGNGAHSGNKFVRESVKKGEPQHVGWASERPDGGRGFGFTGGHFHKNWKDDNFRKAVLNAIVWVAQGEVPKDGVYSKTPEF